jgi:hypothetical protein
MPVDVTLLLTKADHKLIARAGRRSKKAADELIKRIADRAAKTAYAKNQKVARELEDDVDRSGFSSFVTRPVRRR